MDRNKVDKLFEAIVHLDEEITQELQRRLLHVRDTDWQAVIPSIEEDCKATWESLDEARKMLDNLRRKAVQTRDTAVEIHELHKQVQGATVPVSLGKSIATIVEGCLVEGDDVIVVDAVRKQLLDNGVVLTVKNPAAVIASILARDKRLEKVDSGTFKKRENEAS